MTILFIPIRPNRSNNYDNDQYDQSENIYENTKKSSALNTKLLVMPKISRYYKAQKQRNID